MYLYTEKFQMGYGTTWELLVDAEGKPLIYDDLERLRIKYNWAE